MAIPRCRRGAAGRGAQVGELRDVMMKILARCCRNCLALALLVAAWVIALPQAAAADPDKVLHYAFPIAESTFDPAVASDLYSHTVMEAMFDPMLAYDYLARPLKLIPNTLREMPRVEEGGTLFTFHLRPGIYFTPDPAFKGASPRRCAIIVLISHDMDMT